METNKIRVVNGRWWYEDKVGKVFKVLRTEIIDNNEDEDDLSTYETLRIHEVIDPDDREVSYILDTDCVTVSGDQGDAVQHPSHYTHGKYETIDVIEDVTSGYGDGYIAYCVGNAVKYLYRAPFKHESPLEDLRKAAKYIEFAIKRAEGVE
ncbi:DUF3310 domain-containing protein [Virgibacillus proomii]|uniref:DUF3310 domain-containing protein n=1 Tax=Virgibacillus proomii TaxID=84407 RepID=UPI001C0F6CBC|nr:DUF3310 domain-containing protein [Virgibacillus proomii]MBU5266270.1 DUF3310 domain-containing protein [Virgibacillus proomii]